jgi:hypothetical protein
MAKGNRNAGLDPEVDFHEMYRNITTLDFPWDMNQALSFALFRTYAVPSVGALLDETGEFCRRTQKRYDDTALLLEVPLTDGFDGARGRAAMRRINQMHKRYAISNDDMRYVLSTFVVVPIRWIEEFGWRALTDAEVLATVRYFQDLGRHMAIKDVPDTYQGFGDLMDSYEREHFAFDPGARRVADATKTLMTTFYWRPVRPAVEVFARAVMDEPLRRAFGYRNPGRAVELLCRGGLKLRAAAVARFPARRKPLHVADLPRFRSYPNGYRIDRLGTFAPGCPVPH